MTSHGPLPCRACFRSCSADELREGPWLLVNDPGHWGAADPAVLVLGFSKGNTQRTAYRGGEFDAVAFAKSRDRLRNVLARIGLVASDDDIAPRMTAAERDFAFASLLRCSLSKAGKTSGTIMVEALASAPPRDWIRTCVETHLAQLSARTKVVVLLGITARYVEGVVAHLERLHQGRFKRTSLTTARGDGRRYVFVQHPSRLSENQYRAWMSLAPHAKRDAAIAAVKESGVLAELERRAPNR